MHSIVLFTAMTATSGLFGGHRPARVASCNGGACPRPAAVAYAPATTCRTGQYPTAGYAAPMANVPAPAAYAPAAPAVAYNSYYYPATTCTTGTCPRR